MLNVEEVICPDLRLALCHVKEALRAALHTAIVCRSIGGQRPISPKATHSELFDLCYMKTDEQECEQLVEKAVHNFSSVLEDGTACAGRAQLVLSFYATKSRKQSIWNIIVGGDEKIIFEQWRLPVAVQQARRFSSPSDHLREEAALQQSAARQVQQLLHFVVARAAAKVEHLPPPPQSQAAYKFEVSFATAGGKALGGASVLRQGLAPSLSHTIKHLPHVA
eukprot:TRINITY_DN23971_c0_g1_i1.p1 TRINITY_DN23971_c0_g1~~TRINITY_DN23971_c0_g1_i1.p1  ORF type:complete len:222 (+),score=49.91 TRINITY_DN23971_c0_g1_i1:302-967(+)